MTTAPPFTPISPNPYIVGNPVRGRAMFFGREAEFQLIRKRFEHADRGGLLVFCGERRSGKTSILFQILDRRLGDAFIPVLIDMQSMAVASETEFLERLSAEVLAALGTGGVAPPDFSGTTSRSDVFRRFVGDCLRAHPGRKLILLFDEYELFENKIDAGQISDDVLNILAGLMEHASVFMVFTGSQHLEQRRREYWGLLGKSLWKTVSYLEDGDARALIREPVAGRLEYDDDAVAALLRLAAGQPFYTQALCQSLVDHCNDRQIVRASAAIVGEVVTALVDNPLPQMIFMWDGFERDDKLALALLAEALDDDAAYASVEDVLRHLKRRGYPVDLDRARVATALEKLFKSEQLLRDDSRGAPAYAYRMDLWRLWIRRQHSVWQVLREEGLATRTAARRPWVKFAWPALGLVGAIVLVVTQSRRAPPPPASGAAAFASGSGMLMLGVRPEDAVVRMDGRRVGVGPMRDSIAADVDHRLELSAPGYVDTAVTARVARNGRVALMVALRPLLGDLAIDTRPPGAEVRVDGRVAGRSPVTVRGLGTAGTHRVEAALDGYGVAHADAAVRASAVTPLALTLEAGRTDVVVTTDPVASRLKVDGVERGPTPVTLQALSLGRHVFSAARDGSVPIETTIVVTPATRQLALTLAREAPGTLIVLGDLPAQIYVDGALVVENVQNSGPRTVAPGAHALRVVLLSGEALDQRVTVKSGERVYWDFSKNSVTRRTEGTR